VANIHCDPAQRAVLCHRRGPLLVLAGPGTGKTATIVEYLASCLDPDSPGATPVERVLTLTFGRQAAAEVRNRVGARIGGGLLPTITTFHSLSYALLREYASASGVEVSPRLLPAAEQEHRVRELLAHSITEGRVDWPADLATALGTRGLANEVRLVLAKARTLGMDPLDLERAAKEAQNPAWFALSRFLPEYLDVLDAEGVLDYSELIQRAVALAQSDHGRATLRGRYSVILIDEYQDTDPAQVALIKALVTPSTTLIAVGDPDQSIYRFRGADVGGILRFRDDFPSFDGEPAPVVVLPTTRRFGAVIRDAASAVISRVPLGPLPVEAVRQHRSPRVSTPHPGEVSVLTFDSAVAQAASVADDIKRARLAGMVERWADVAVLLRGAGAEMELVRQALVEAGVPVEVNSDEIALRSCPALQPVLDVLRIADDARALTPARCATLLASPLVGCDSSRIRSIGRRLRSERRADRAAAGMHSADLVCAAVADPSSLAGVDDSIFDPLRSLAELLDSARASVVAGEPVEEILWHIWQSTPWQRRLLAAAGGVESAARLADRDLDSVVALFNLAGRSDTGFSGPSGVSHFLGELDRQEMATDARAPETARRDAVALMTAHRSKGLQWSDVYLVGVQEGQWPDLRSRGSLLESGRLVFGGRQSAPSVGEILNDERRLFYVACTRARRRLVLAAVASVGDDGDQPSRFVDAVRASAGVRSRHQSGYQLNALTESALVGALRFALQDPLSSMALREAAAERLAMLVSQGAVAANPANWWAVREFTDGVVPVRPVEAPVALSASAWNRLSECSLRWFLEHEVRADTPRAPAMAFGSVVHALANAVAEGEISGDHGALTDRATDLWAGLSYEADWQASNELSEATAALSRFALWHGGANDRELLGSEVGFNREVEVGDDRVTLRGSVDRLERDVAGRLHIVDLKTEKLAKTARELAEHRQLALYQVVAAEGAFSDTCGSDLAEIGGAELVQLRIDAGGLPKVQRQAPLDVGEVKRQLGDAIALIRNEGFTPSPERQRCRTCAFTWVCPAAAEGSEVVS
jgi:superfamily I DNA/RNA helicase/RecB family exonuclease